LSNLIGVNQAQPGGRGARGVRPAPSHWGRTRAVSCLGLLTAAALLLGATWPGQSRGEDAGTGWVRHSVPVEGELGDVLTVDLNHDGMQDLVVLELDRSRRGAPARLVVYLQSAAGFQLVASATETLPEGLTLVTAGQFLQGAGVALLTPEGVEVRIWREGRFRPLPGMSLPMESLFTKAGGEPRASLPWAVDLNGDGKSELVVPRLDGFNVLRQDAAGRLLLHARLRTRPRGFLQAWLQTLYHRRQAAYELPIVEYRNVNQSGWTDVVAYLDGVVSVFFLDDRGDSGDRAPDVEMDLQPPRPFDPAQPWDPPMLLITAQDLNADGLLDLVFSKNKTGDSEINAKTVVLIYYGRKGEKGLAFGAEPDQVFPTEGFTMPILLDLDRNGRVDLLQVNVEITYWTAIKAWLAKSVSADASLYHMAAGGRYPSRPDEQGSFAVKFSLGRFSHQPIATFGDLNGDGLPDLLLSVGKDQLGIHWGRRGGMWRSEPEDRVQGSFPIHGSRVRVLDLDGDGRDDLLLIYYREDIRQMPEVNHSFTVLLSRFGNPKAATARRP